MYNKKSENTSKKTLNLRSPEYTSSVPFVAHDVWPHRTYVEPHSEKVSSVDINSTLFKQIKASGPKYT
jgi:hypothetical protein